MADIPRNPGSEKSAKQESGRDLLEFCRDRRSDVLLFTEDTGVWPTNNISERGVRPLKTQQKISGCIATARKHGKNAMDVLHALMLSTPLRPPAHAFSP